MSEPEQTPVTPPAETPPPAAPPEVKKEQRGPGKPGKGPRFQKPRVASEPVRNLEHEQRPNPPRLKEIDDEIAGELEAAMGGFSQQDLLAVDSSRRVRQQTAATEDKGRKKGKVISIHGPDVFVEVPGGRSQGMLSMDQFPDAPPKVGDVVDISIEGYDSANGLLILSRRGAAVTGGDWNTLAEGMTVEARVTESNKGGLAVEVNGLRGFMPVSQIDIYRVEQPEQFVNQKLLCLVTEISPAERNLVVSRRAYLERDREEKREKLWQELAEGQVREGVVRSVREFGAFVDIGGADGLLHVGEMSWQRVQDPSKIVQPGQAVRVVVLKLDRESRKIGLGLKQLQTSPWETLRDRFHVNQVVKGTVTRIMEFGAFVEIEPGIEGLVHISELAPKRVFRVTDIVKAGQEVEVKIQTIDEEQRRIGLSIKAVLAAAAAPKVEQEPEEEYVPEPPRVRKTPLRGGIGQEKWLILPEDENDAS